MSRIRNICLLFLGVGGLFLTLPMRHSFALTFQKSYKKLCHNGFQVELTVSASTDYATCMAKYSLVQFRSFTVACLSIWKSCFSKSDMIAAYYSKCLTTVCKSKISVMCIHLFGSALLKWGWWWNLWLTILVEKNLFNQPPTQTYPNKNIRSHCAIFNTRLRFTSFRLFFRACFFLSEMSTGENAPKFGTSNNRQIWESSSKIGWKVDHTKITKTILSLYFSVLKNGSKMCSPCEVCEHDVKTNDARLWMPQQSNKRL